MAANVNNPVGSVLLILILCSLVSITVGEYCYDYHSSFPSTFNQKFCPYGCCGYDRSQCCSTNIGLIVGLCVGGGVLVVIIVVVIICCRRRHYAGVIVRNQAAQPTVVVAQSTSASQGGMIATGGYQPGYPPQPYGNYPQYPVGYPAAAYPQQGPAGYPPQGPAGYPPQATGGYPPQAPGGVVQSPPSYDSLNKQQVS